MKANSFIKRLMVAFSYLTLFFPKARGKELPASSLAYFPLVGLLLGCLLWLCAYTLDGIFYPAINALVLVSLLAVVTRGVPLDGLASLLDGMRRQGTAKEMGRAMRSHQRGSFGVIALCLALLAKYLLVSQLIEDGALPSLLLFPTLGRWSMVCLVWFFPDQSALLPRRISGGQRPSRSSAPSLPRGWPGSGSWCLSGSSAMPSVNTA